jgi:hypothetical protein
MSSDCTDICEIVMDRLEELGFILIHGESSMDVHDQMIEALQEVQFVRIRP